MTQPFTWNHRVHEVWGESRLCFWRFRFNPTYQSRRIRDGLIAALATAGVTSYAVYELLGYYDILVRIWLPFNISVAKMEELFFENLQELDFEDSEFFEVARIERHWPWGDGEPATPPDAFLGAGLNAAFLERANRFATGDLSRADFNDEEIKTLDSWLTNRLLIAFEPADGVKFFVSIRRSLGSLARLSHRNLLRRIAEACDTLTQNFHGESSLYDGSNEYLVIGRLPFDQFYEGLQAFLADLNNIGVNELFRTRTFTFIALQPTFMAFRDKVRTVEPAAPPDIDIEELFRRGEGESIEFKASAFANVKRWLNDDNQLVPMVDQVAQSALAKAICGLLNARRDGVVLLGVGERSRLLGKMSGQTLDRATRLLDQYMAFGDLVLFGTALDIAAEAARDWDEYVRRIQRLIANDIVPDPQHVLQVLKLDSDGGSFAAVTVRSVESDDWYYVRDNARYRFYVRRNGLTEELVALEQDRYKREFARRQGI